LQTRIRYFISLLDNSFLIIVRIPERFRGFPAQENMAWKQKAKPKRESRENRERARRRKRGPFQHHATVPENVDGETSLEKKWNGKALKRNDPQAGRPAFE
jgi:hypothetical protein